MGTGTYHVIKITDPLSSQDVKIEGFLKNKEKNKEIALLLFCTVHVKGSSQNSRSLIEVPYLSIYLSFVGIQIIEAIVRGQTCQQTDLDLVR